MALPDLCSTAMWVKFFTDSGIPNSVAANYAVTFFDNRITRNMLLDLNKEILQDMGISVMGDVIAILKHAKVVHAQMTREKVYQSETSIASISPVTLQQKAKPNTIQSNRLGSRLGNMTLESSSAITVQNPAKKVVTRKRVNQEEVPMPKVRRVLPEHEGAYKITMPTGTTALTKKILGMKNATATKSSVFRRLGDETKVRTATSTVVQPKVVAKQPKPSITTAKGRSVFQRLGPENSTAAAATAVVTIDNDIVAVDDDDVINMDDYNYDDDEELSLEYEGILLAKEKPDVIQKRVIVSSTETANAAHTRAIKSLLKNTGPKTVINKSVMRFAKTSATAAPAATSSPKSSQGIMVGLSAPTTKSVYSRLGKKVIFQPTAKRTNSPTIITKKIVTAAPKAILKKKVIGNIISTKKTNTGIKARLGQTSVFGRLGPSVDV